MESAIYCTIKLMALLCLAFCLCALPGASAPSEPSDRKHFLAGKRVLWLGDSITHNGLYVSFVEYYLNTRFPRQSFDIVSIGLSGETASGLSEKTHPYPRPCVHERLQRALDRVRPEVVVACYGMNDGIYHPQSPERMRAFQDGITRLAAAVKARGAVFILMTPLPFDPDPIAGRTRPEDASDFSWEAPYAEYDSVLADYAQWETTLRSPDVMVFDMRTAIQTSIRQRRAMNPRFSFSGDGIHPSDIGHLLMARTFVRALDLPLPDIILEPELKRIQSDPLWDLVNQRRQKRSDGWLAYVGYTRETTVRAISIAETEAAAAAQQREIDRRRMMRG